MSKAIVDVDESKLDSLGRLRMKHKDVILEKLNQVAVILDDLASKHGLPMIALSCNYFDFTNGGIKEEAKADFIDFTTKKASIIAKERITRAKQWEAMHLDFMLSA